MVFKCTEILNWLYSTILAVLPLDFKRSVFHFCQGDHQAGCTHPSPTLSHRTRRNSSISSHWAPPWHPTCHWLHLAWKSKNSLVWMWVTKSEVMWEYVFLWTLSNLLSSEWRKFSLEWNAAPNWIRRWLRKSLEEKIMRNYDLAHRYSKKVGPIPSGLSLYNLFWMWA